MEFPLLKEAQFSLHSQLNRRNLLMLPIILTACCISSGCGRYEGDLERSSTWVRLQEFGLVMLELQKRGVDLGRFSSIEDIVTAANEKKVGFSSSSVPITQDFWRKPLRCVVTPSKNDQVSIRIISDGLDGVFSNGEGDDLYVEIRIDNQGKTHMDMKPFPP